jgi:VIT1/CCC1 family predicted Fe2+/Mn2+ transporter
MKPHTHTRERATFVRNFVFGVEDSLVSTVGLLSGVAIASVPRATILLTGFILIFVEAFSMGIGSFLSEYSAQDYIGKKRTQSSSPTVMGAVIMFFSYFLSGFLPLFPYIAFSLEYAFPISIGVALVALFILGFISGAVAHVNVFRSAVRMFLVGGVAVIVGAFVGYFLK